ncbi:MAG: protein-L-isoaspartate O-methyltransferase [Candidatus Aenigmarchaeota archaeon]|nr:protein-L-isoaspartate O-methyltransferase [Candidatus Aenigmarchaeota archaeon]
MNLVEVLVEQGCLKTPEIIFAFRKIKRIDFLPEELKQFAELNGPLPIGYEQTISQPLTVAIMLELLQPKKGDKILDIGSGSGWTTSLLSKIVGKSGKVYGIELIRKLKEFGEKNTEKYNFVEKGIAKFICVDGSKGLPEKAPFDKILVSASADKIPSKLREQLKIEGRLVIPIKNSIFLIIRKSNRFEEEEFFGFSFVPLIKRD